MNPKVLKFKNLQDRIKRLVSRMEIMNRLLREAKIPIPSACSWKEFKHKNYKWSGKIDEVKDTVIKPVLTKKKLTVEKCKSNSDIETGNKLNLLSKHRKCPMNKKKSEQKPLQPSTSKCVIIYTQAYNTSPCYLVSSTLSNNFSGSSQTVSTNSVQASNPSIALNVKESGNPSTQSNSKIQSIGGGTLILTKGSIYPILQQPKPILPSSMLLQVNDNTDNNDANIKQKVSARNKIVDGQKKNRDGNSNKNCIIKKSNLKTTKGTVKNPCLQMKPKLSPNVLPLGSNISIRKNSYLLPTQMNPILIPNSSDILRPKVSFTGITKRRAVGKRIGDKPVSRQALKRIGKLARQKELEARKTIEHNPTNSNTPSNNENEIFSQKNRSNIEDTEKSSVQEVNKFNEQKNDGSTDKTGIQDLDAQKSISIIADEVIRESSQNVFAMDSEVASTITQVCKPNNTNENMLENKEKEEISIGEVSKEETQLLDNNSDKTELILKQNNIHLEKSKCHNETDIVPEKQNENEHSKNVESTEKLHSCGNELQNMNSLSVSNSEQIIQTENNSDLENVCSNVNQQLKNLDIHLGHSELSSDLFASLQVPPGCQNPESTSPTAAFLLAFPLVSSLTGVKVTEVIDEENPDSQRETPTLLQIGTMDTNKSGQSENFNSNLLNLDFFSSKDIYGGFYNSFEHLSGLSVLQTSSINENQKGVEKITDNSKTSYNKPSMNMGNIQPSDSPKQSTTVETNATTENVPRNAVYSSSDIDCQPRFLFDEKQPSSICLYEKDKAQIIPSESYSDKSIEQYSQGKNPQNKNDNAPIENAKKRNDDVGKIHLPQSMNQNFQTKVEFVKDSVSQNKSSSKSENSFLRIESCDNIFNAGGINNNHSKGCEHDVSMNFYSEKQKLLMSDHFNTQDMNTRNKNVASLHQENMHNVQIPLMENKHFVPSSINSNQVGSSFNIDINTSFTSKNMNSLTKEVSSFSNTEIQPYFLQDKNYQSISNQVNSKSSNLEGKNTETLKYINYGNFISDPKKSLKDNDLNPDFNLESKVSSIGKTTNAKDITCNFNMGYPNSAYDINNITKIVTCAYNSGKPPSDPLYTNSNNHTYNYYSNSDNYISEVCYKNSKIDKNPVSEAEIFTNYKRTDYNVFYPDNPRKVINCSKSENIQDKSTYNWMTTPAKPSNVISNFQKDEIIYSNANLISGNQNNYFNPVSTYTTELTTTLNQTSKKTFDLPLANINYQKSEIEDGQNQFSWSPTKIPQFLDPVPTFVSSTLPTLVGDLALGSSNLMDQKYEFTNRSSKETKNKVSSRLGYDSNQSNFLSVSQLVHQNDKNVPGKPSRRRNSAGASKNNQLKNKKVIKSNEDPKAVSQCFNKPLGNEVPPKIENKSYNCRQIGNINCEKRNSQKVNSSIYSAEALISQQSHSENSTKKDQKFPGNTMKNVPVPPYLPDNIMPYFPTVDLQQENIMQQNQNYQNFPSFTTFSNNTYSTNNFIPSSSTTPYISSSSFASDVGAVNEVSSENINIFPGTPISKIKLTTKNREEKNDSHNACTNIGIKKVKRKPSNEICATSNLVDFSFLSVPGSIHSPILPDDFHTHTTYLPPPPPQPQLYPCKNTFYPAKQSTISSTGSLLPIPPLSSVTRSGLQHPDVSPSLNSVGTSSLTNFNLSTIFPEINKSSMSDIYTGSQSKDQGTNKHFSNSAIPFSAKPPFSYPSCPITQPYEIDNR